LTTNSFVDIRTCTTTWHSFRWKNGITRTGGGLLELNYSRKEIGATKCNGLHSLPSMWFC